MNTNPELRKKMIMSGEVAAALHDGRAVVALESTVIAHGLPRPVNVETALAMEEAVREGRAVPATIALLDGRIHVGLSKEAIERIGAEGDIGKASLRDLPLLLARGGSGGTTVSATAYLAAQAGISVFATGGIGGVHRGWESTPDISADLPALASTPVVTVCAGAKSVLDLPSTLEWLETHGVPVLGYRTEQFPAFYSRRTEPALPVDLSVQEAREVADVYLAQRRLDMSTGLLLCVPIPQEDALPPDEIEEVIARALAEASKEGIKGREVTPYLLSALSRATEGRTLNANRALLLNNARVGAEVARAIRPPQYA